MIIDEAGMADTLSLDTAVQFAIDRGASVRLVGDDQQLAAIGAGGVLRDIKHSHGALRLTELHRFTDPAEAAASLALREGKPEALDFYLDHGRVHVGDLATTTEDAFSAWVSDRAAGLDAIMLAPTRNLVAELNPEPALIASIGAPCGIRGALADGNQASVGDVIITRSNDRRLRLTATDWVKNGDRWTITHVGKRRPDRATQPQPPHRPAARRLRSATSTGLGYATTIHAAQGVTADTMHGLLTGQESRQQLYTMLTRGRAANHLYLQVVGDGDPHTLIRPETVAPRTPTETLQQILARDDAPTSATTLLRELSDPAARLFEAVQRYTDGLHVAAEQLVGPQIVQMLDGQADQIVPELTSEPSWPTLRAHLLALAAETGEHPLLHLQAAAAGRELTPPKTWPPYSTGASRSPHPPTQDRCPGFPAFRKRFMIITFGASTWRSGRSSLSASQIRFETAPARSQRTARMGTAGQPPDRRPPSVKSPSGVPPSASTPKTADQPEQDNYKRRRPLATEPRPRRCPVQPPPWRRCRETPDWWTLSRSPARRSTSHASNTRCSSECPARAPLVSASVSSRDLGDQRLRPGAEQMARMKSSTCVQDRLRLSEALGLATTVTGIGRSLSTDCRSTGAASDLCWIVVTGRTRAPLDYDRSETERQDKRRTSMNDPAAKVRVLYSVPEAMALLNLSRTQIYELIRTSRLVTVTQGRRRLVPADSITDYVQLLLAECRAGGNGHAA